MHAWPSRLGLAAVALTLALGLPAAAAASPALGCTWSSPAAAALDLCSNGRPWLQALWLDVGCGSAPSGQKCGTSAVQPQIGCGSDPNGQHCPGNAPAPTTARGGRFRRSGANGA